MDWIHCNECFSQPAASGGGGPLHLTSCGHIFCHNCRPEGVKNGKCKICGNECSCIQLVQDMKPQVREFFTEPDEILLKLLNIIKFQKQHRAKLTAHRVSLEYKYKEIKIQMKKLTQIAQKMHNDLIKLQKENKALKANITSPLHTKSPFAVHSTPVPVFLSPSDSAIATPHRSKHQIFQSNLVTPQRVSRTHFSGRYDLKECNTMNTGNFKMPTSLLTPSTISSNRSN